MKKILAVLFSVFILAGCSTTFAYKNIDWLIYWYLDDFIDFTDEQEETFDTYLQKWLAWHKANEMPKYLAHINQLVDEISTKQLSIARMEYHRQKTREHWERARDYIAPDLVELAPMLSDKQIEDMFTAFEKELKDEEKDYKKLRDKPPEKRKKDWVKKYKKRISKWLGSLTEEQKNYIENSYDSILPSRQLWIDYNRRYQGELKKTFEEQADKMVFSERLHALLVEPEVYRSEALNQAFERNSQANMVMLQTLLVLSTDKQQKRLVNEIDDYRQDLIDLMAWSRD
ncbi:DUF6279 family lipoprotein [Agaribacter flavus]|uniref:DUF6279 family lipoprotein n=1 Tax=Agaribacter flavus TaxID=1902781 RepID=A0ABV7FJW1_9ALTE